MKITGLDKLQRTLDQAVQAAAELDGQLGKISFNANDKSSVEAAITEANLIVDSRLSAWYGNPIVDQLAKGAKASFEKQILDKAEKHKLANPLTQQDDSDPVSDALRQIRDTIGDLRRADYQTFDRHAARLARLLDGDALAEITAGLTKDLDLTAWLAAGEATEGSMVGSARLSWPDTEEGQLGMTILLARRFAGDSREAMNFAFTFYYNGSKITANLQHMVSQVFVPFERDFTAYVERRKGVATGGEALVNTTKYPRRVFIVHGHDAEVREAVARFMGTLGFDVIILHEQANKGRTIIEKFEEHADVGFAIVLLTPDDLGSTKDGSAQPRARQNVILELGYFLGKLGRERVVALKRAELELPSDFLGIVYTTFDDAGAWKQALAKELQAADYDVDWNVIMRGK